MISIWVGFLPLYICNLLASITCLTCSYARFISNVGTDVSTGEEVGIKLECVKLKHPQLHIESKIYKILQGGGKL